MDIEFTKREKEVFTNLDEEFGYSLPSYLRNSVQELTLLELGIDKSDLNDIENQDIYIEKLKAWASGLYLEKKYRSQSVDDEDNAKVPKKIYDKPFERRFKIVEFINESWARSGRSRINWKKVTDEWNEAHPYDNFNKIQSIKSLYNQAIRQWPVIMMILTRQIYEFSKTKKELVNECTSKVVAEYNAERNKKDVNGEIAWGDVIFNLWTSIVNQGDIFDGRSVITSLMLHNYLMRIDPDYRKQSIEDAQNLRNQE